MLWCAVGSIDLDKRGAIYCMYAPGDSYTSLSYKIELPHGNLPSDYSIISEVESIPNCSSYWRPVSPLNGEVMEIGASSPNYSLCTGKVEYVIQHVSGKQFSFSAGASHTYDP